MQDIDWKTYTLLGRILAERRSIRMTYDRGVLEIMNMTFRHESSADFLGRFVVVLSEERGQEVACGGSTTLRRRKKQRGLEPDNCYWLVNEFRVRGKDRIDLRIDPPPDLVLEIDITSCSLDRLSIYAVLGVPEVWRFDGRALTFHVLEADGNYSVRTHSVSFPFVSAADLSTFLALRGQMGENAIVRQFRAWVRQRLAAGGTPPSVP
jgi:Uma2 family endonuclease